MTRPSWPLAGSTWPSPPHLFTTRRSPQPPPPQVASGSSPREVQSPSPKQAQPGRYVAYLLPPLPLGDDWAASVASVYAPQSPTVSFSPSASASPLASIASVSPLASRDKPLPEPPTNCSSPEPESGRGTRSDRPPEVPQSGTDRHRADHGRDHVYDDNDIEHDRYHKHGKKPSYDYDEYSYQFQPGYEPECETNQRRDEPPVEPLEDYALPLAPFRQRENYDYALILAKELCTLTRDTSGLTVTSIHELREEIRRVLDSFAPSQPRPRSEASRSEASRSEASRSEASHGDHRPIASPKKDATLAELLDCAHLAKAAHRSVIAHFGELERGGPIDVDLLKEVDSSHFLRFVRAVDSELERMPPRWQLSRRLVSLREKASGWASDVWAVLEDVKEDERWRVAQRRRAERAEPPEPLEPSEPLRRRRRRSRASQRTQRRREPDGDEQVCES
ncbi:hypothetical protein JCM24511_02587 [Saitozyma sp. JCM 24511]|nr:hypothetical protein JCM24511_02587 [Saitozyma sp. JCM 24511]